MSQLYLEVIIVIRKILLSIIKLFKVRSLF